MIHNGYNYLPILFQPEMVKAILEGRKTQTRRLHEKPKYKVGNRLWVRETWRPIGWDLEGSVRIQYKDGFDMRRAVFERDDTGESEGNFIERVCALLDSKGCPVDVEKNSYQDIQKYMPWKPSIHMPFGAHRIELEVIGVKQERLWDISELDAIAEGVENVGGCVFRNYFDETKLCLTAKKSFLTLWSKINGLDSAQSNPLVTAYTFKRILQ